MGQKYQLTQLAEYLHVSRVTVSLWAKKGCPYSDVRSKSGAASKVFDIDEVAEWRSKQLRTNRGHPGLADYARMEAVQAPSPPAEHTEEDRPSGNLHRKRLEAQVAKDATMAALRKLELDIKKGKYLPRTDIIEGWALRVREVRRRLQNLARELPSQLVNLTEPEMQAIIAKRVEEICAGYANNPAIPGDVKSVAASEVFTVNPHAFDVLGGLPEAEHGETISDPGGAM